jgi:RHS repeat-associated protein
LIQSSSRRRRALATPARNITGDVALYYYNARWYDAKTGTFISRDPLGLAPDVNPYRYVGNSPTNAIDPTGRVQVTIYADAFIPMAKVLNPMLNGYLKGDDREISATPAPEEKSRAGNWIIVETDARIDSRKKPIVNKRAWISLSTLTTFSSSIDVAGHGIYYPPETITKRGEIKHTEDATRLSDCSVEVVLKVSAHLPREFAIAPSIDYTYRLIVSSDCYGNVTVTGYGAHDGFPAYELYVDGTLVYSYDPRPAGQTPLSLFGSRDTKTGPIRYGNGCSALPKIPLR